ncbi:hypothetical protein PR003_g18750 [Phytophthora rubi]|uniref:Uncharacterized protein n=2 Tax=Phytophthora rubi TaxID=129364 RepID=A0A6A3K9A9_9STRA|nr:hypothetical protein PR001_g17823 [Phytophthora rubi]KAE9316322.1 hypothetical protein PR003_g18750 [Phytophthora rubi]
MSAPSSTSAGPGSQPVVPGAPDVGGGSGHHSDHTPPGADTPDEVQPPIPVNAPPDSPHPNGSAGDDESSSAGQDSATRSVSPQPVVSRTGVLDFEEVVRHVRARVLPSHDQSSPGMQNTPPARFTLPPPRNLVGESFIVGIPAHAMAHRNGAYVREGCGGVEALMLFDGLSEPDMQDLCALVGDPAELAQRTFNTVSLLHRVLARDRQREHVLQGMDENSIARRLLRLQSEHDRLKEDFVFLYGYHQQETQSIRDEASHAQGLLDADFARLARENLEETATLRQRNDDLESQLRYAQSQISTLEQRVRDKRFDADGLLAFLNTGSNEVRGNWPRFRKLLGQFQRGVATPPSWKTWITVEAADKSFRMIPPYPGPAPPDSDEGDDDMEQEEKSEDNPPSPKPEQDASRGKEPRKS